MFCLLLPGSWDQVPTHLECQWNSRGSWHLPVKGRVIQMGLHWALQELSNLKKAGLWEAGPAHTEGLSLQLMPSTPGTGRGDGLESSDQQVSHQDKVPGATFVMSLMSQFCSHWKISLLSHQKLSFPSKTLHSKDVCDPKGPHCYFFPDATLNESLKVMCFFTTCLARPLFCSVTFKNFRSADFWM